MLKKEIENIEEYNWELDKRIIHSNAQSQTKLTEVRKDLGSYVKINNLNVKIDNKNEETSIRILDIDLKINTQNTKTTTDIGELERKLKI